MIGRTGIRLKHGHGHAKREADICFFLIGSMVVLQHQKKRQWHIIATTVGTTTIKLGIALTISVETISRWSSYRRVIAEYQLDKILCKSLR